MLNMDKWKFGFSIGCNECKPYHTSLERYIDDMNIINPESICSGLKERIMETGELWEFSGYPNNSVGSYGFWASSWEELLSCIREVEQDA